MKLLLDFLPLILFFGTFKYGEGHKDWASSFANEHFGMLVSGGQVTPDQAPVLLATLMAVVATLAAVLIQKLRGQKIDMMLWITLAVVSVLGGLTVWFHNDTFIKWKPSVVYWALGLIYWGSVALFGIWAFSTSTGITILSVRFSPASTSSRTKSFGSLRRLLPLLSVMFSHFGPMIIRRISL